jgi:hypothetical protein
MAADLTCLTSLSICTHGPNIQQMAAAIAAQNLNLIDLTLTTSYQPLESDLLKHVLTSCTRLSSLTLHGLTVDDPGLAAVLTHGTSITSLDLGSTALTTSQANRSCSWWRLSIYGHLQEFACLPLHSIQDLTIRATEQMQLPPHLTPFILTLPADLPTEQAAALLHQATTNLSSCPACTRSPPSELYLLGHNTDDLGWTAPLHLQLLHNLAPLSTWKLTQLTYDMPAALGGTEMEALANTFGPTLTSLNLRSFLLEDSFWQPLAQRFPHLRTLALGDGLHAGLLPAAMYLVAFSRTAHQQLHLYITNRTFKSSVDSERWERGKRLQQLIDEWHLTNITLEVISDCSSENWMTDSEEAEMSGSSAEQANTSNSASHAGSLSEEAEMSGSSAEQANTSNSASHAGSL